MKHTPGLFGWVDLMSRDVGASKDFYCALFGWTATDMPTPMGVDYTQFALDGQTVAGLGPMPPDMAATDMPSVWNSYVLVEDADEIAVKAAAAGGQVVMPAMDVMDQGRMLMVADPAGAVVGVWQPMLHEGAEVFNVPGSLTWNELNSWDVEASKAFYAEVFGWVWADAQMEGYSVAKLPGKPGDDKSNAGAMAMPPGVPQGAPSSWMVYFAVGDCDAAMAKATELGGSVFLPAMDMGTGRFGGLVDPTGAMFMVGGV